MSQACLMEYLKKMRVSAKFFKFDKHTTTVDAAVNRLDVSREKIVKSILFIDNSGLPVLGIVTGDKRINERKLAIACAAKEVRRANLAEVKTYTGYEAGAVPPVGHKTHIRTFIDEKVMNFDKVIGGGGQIDVLMEISPTEIKRLMNGEVKNMHE
jgi:Cys-tRNA(Pro)/Cys-tRNA(Cys) deacylase